MQCWIIVYRKAHGLEVDCYVLLFLKGCFKRRFNRSHVTKVSAQTFGKTLYRFPDFINRKYFTLILKTMILTALVNSVTGMEIFTIRKQPPTVLLKFKSKFRKIHGKHLCECLFFNEVAGLRPATLQKNRLQHRCFPVNFVKFLRIPFWKATVSQNMKAF